MDFKGIDTSPAQPVVVLVSMTVSISDRSVSYAAQLMVHSHKLDDVRKGMDTAWESMRTHIEQSDEGLSGIDDD